MAAQTPSLYSADSLLNTQSVSTIYDNSDANYSYGCVQPLCHLFQRISITSSGTLTKCNPVIHLLSHPTPCYALATRHPIILSGFHYSSPPHHVQIWRYLSESRGPRRLPSPDILPCKIIRDVKLVGQIKGKSTFVFIPSIILFWAIPFSFLLSRATRLSDYRLLFGNWNRK
jgi:hypothetical protein